METKIYTITDPEKVVTRSWKQAEVMKNGGIVGISHRHCLCGRRIDQLRGGGGQAV